MEGYGVNLLFYLKQAVNNYYYISKKKHVKSKENLVVNLRYAAIRFVHVNFITILIPIHSDSWFQYQIYRVSHLRCDRILRENGVTQKNNFLVNDKYCWQSHFENISKKQPKNWQYLYHFSILKMYEIDFFVN